MPLPRRRTPRCGPIDQHVDVVERFARHGLAARRAFVPWAVNGLNGTALVRECPRQQLGAHSITSKVSLFPKPDGCPPVRRWGLGTPDAGRRSAVIYSIIASCRRHGIDPGAYLKEALERLAAATNKTIGTFTPAP